MTIFTTIENRAINVIDFYVHNVRAYLFYLVITWYQYS